MSFRWSLSCLLLVWVAGCHESAATSSEQSAQPQAAPAAPVAPQLAVRIGYQKIGAPFLLKERSESLQAALAKHNAKAEWIEFQAGPPILEAIRGNALDVGYTGETPPVFAQAGGVPFVYIAREEGAPASEAILVQKDSKLKTVADLKGKKIALNRGSNVHYLLLKALESAQLTIKDVTVTYLAPADARAAFDSNQVDAWVIWDPFQASAEVAGARVLRDGQGIVENNFFYLARREFAEKNQALVHTVLAEFNTLNAWAAKSPEDTARLLSKSSGIAYEALFKSEGRHIYKILPIDDAVLAKQQAIADAFFALELIPQAVKTSAAYLPDAKFGSGS
jgi:sulfonate transport system substrate-binding protein